MTIAEKVENFYRRLFSVSDSDQELSILADFLVQLSGEPLADRVRYFTTRLDEVIANLQQLTLQNKHPGQSSRIENSKVWVGLAWGLAERKLPQAAHDLLTALYEFQLSQQNEHRRRYYKGVSLLNLGWINYVLENHSAARHATHLALIEEILNTLDMDEAAQLKVISINLAYRMLTQTFKVPLQALEAFVRFSRGYALTHPERCAYPEDCFVGYLRASAVGQIRPTVNEPFRTSNFNYGYFTNLLDLVGRSVSASAAEPLLADLACYLFATADDFKLCEHEQSLSTDDFDLIVYNCAKSDVTISTLGGYIGIDWHYWMRGLTVSDLFTIVGKLRTSNLQTAILLVRNYESSPADLSKLHATVQNLQRQEGLSIIVITQQQLISIERKLTSLPILIKQKAESLKFNLQSTVSVDSSASHAPIEKVVLEPIRLSPPVAITQPPPPSPAVAIAPPITVITPPPTTPTPMTTVPPVKLPRLVIKSPASKAQKEPQPPTIYKTQTPRGTDPPLLLKPCSNCKNPTSLSCKNCSKPLCNIHLDMKTLTCEECLRSGNEKPTDGFDSASSTPIME